MDGVRSPNFRYKPPKLYVGGRLPLAHRGGLSRHAGGRRHQGHPRNDPEGDLRLAVTGIVGSLLGDGPKYLRPLRLRGPEAHYCCAWAERCLKLSVPVLTLMVSGRFG
jgi:hypothetical protein